MRRLLLLFISAALLTAGISCELHKTPAEEAGKVVLDNSDDIVFPEIGGSSLVTFSATREWRASVNAEWLQVEPNTGKAGASLSVIVSASANKTTGKLTAQLSIVCGNDEKIVNVILSEPIELPQDPVNPPATWPSDKSAFDYGLDSGAIRKAKIGSDEFAAYGVTSNAREIKSPIIVDNVTYGGPGLAYYDNRVAASKVNIEWSIEYPDVIPAQSYFSFKINRPGGISFFQSLGSGTDRIPTYYLAVVTTKGGKSTAKIVDEFTPTKVTDIRPANPYNGDYNDYIVTMYVPESAIEGISTAATVYLFHRWTKGYTCQVNYYPFTWTVGAQGDQTGERVPKILIAGDSGCCVYGAESRPQTGWGECLSDALGGGVQISNHAIGGESTKSFIDEGRWAGLRAGIYTGDIVLIHFGANDEKSDEAHATDPYTTYQANLKTMIDDTRAKGGVPVLVTSMCRLYYHSNGNPMRTHGDYPAAMKALGESTNTPVIDLEELTYQWLKGLGSLEAATPYFVRDKRDPAKDDRSHLTGEGAEIVAGMVAKGLKDLGVWKK